MKRIIISFVVLFIFIVGGVMLFDNKKEKTSCSWDVKSGIYSIPERELKYIVPTDVSFWAIAQEGTKPAQMDFFGIDTQNEICVGLFSPDLPLNALEKNVTAYSETELDNIVRYLSDTSGTSQVVVSEKINKNRVRYMDSDAWHYVLSRKMIDKSAPKDTIDVYYSGFIFNNKKIPYGIVVISGLNPSDSVGGILFHDYCNGLTTM